MTQWPSMRTSVQILSTHMWLNKSETLTLVVGRETTWGLLLSRPSPKSIAFQKTGCDRIRLALILWAQRILLLQPPELQACHQAQLQFSISLVFLICKLVDSSDGDREGPL